MGKSQSDKIDRTCKFFGTKNTLYWTNNRKQIVSDTSSDTYTVAYTKIIEPDKKHYNFMVNKIEEL